MVLLSHPATVELACTKLTFRLQGYKHYPLALFEALIVSLNFGKFVLLLRNSYCFKLSKDWCKNHLLFKDAYSVAYLGMILLQFD